MPNTTPPPKFHKDGTISYFSVRYNRWYYRVSPLRIPYAILQTWDKDQLARFRDLAPDRFRALFD